MYDDLRAMLLVPLLLREGDGGGEGNYQHRDTASSEEHGAGSPISALLLLSLVDVGVCFDARLQLHEAQLVLAAWGVAAEPVHGLDVEGSQLVRVRVEGVGGVLLQGEVLQERGEPVVQRGEGEGGFRVDGGREEGVELGWGEG